MKSSAPIETFHGWSGDVLAHQGGWDEILLVLGPLAVVGLLLWVANRRVSAKLEESAGIEGLAPGDGADRPEPTDRSKRT
jgi:hypothetical protein